MRIAFTSNVMLFCILPEKFMIMNLFRFFLCAILFFGCNQSETPSSSISLSGNETEFSFPQSWKGKWKGDLEIFSRKGKAQTIPMELHIFPLDSTDAWSWTIYYGEDKITGKRDYVLKPKDVEQGIYVVDEQNSILLDAYLFDGKLVERFEVMGSLLTTMTELRGDQLVWEIISGSTENLTSTGDTIDGTDTIPEVKSYPMTVMQRAYLSRF